MVPVVASMPLCSHTVLLLTASSWLHLSHQISTSTFHTQRHSRTYEWPRVHVKVQAAFTAGTAAACSDPDPPLTGDSFGSSAKISSGSIICVMPFEWRTYNSKNRLDDHMHVTCVWYLSMHECMYGVLTLFQIIHLFEHGSHPSHDVAFDLRKGRIHFIQFRLQIFRDIGSVYCSLVIGRSVRSWHFLFCVTQEESIFVRKDTYDRHPYVRDEMKMLQLRISTRHFPDRVNTFLP